MFHSRLRLRNFEPLDKDSVFRIPSGEPVSRAAIIHLERPSRNPPLCGFDPARRFFENCFAATDPAVETLFVAYLDPMARCIRLSRHDGDADGVDWPLRAILIEAARCNCAGLVVAHNHPSGDATPSASDRDATRRLATATEAIDVVLLDHLVVAGDHVSSFRRMGLL